jgi:hypothetical protein
MIKYFMRPFFIGPIRVCTAAPSTSAAHIEQTKTLIQKR